MGIGGVDNDGVEAAVGLGYEFRAVINDGFEPLVGEYRLGEFREMLLGELDHLGVDLDLGQPLDRLVLEHLLGDAAVAAADDQNVARIAMGEQRHMRHHLLVDEFVAFGYLGRAVEHQHLAEIGLLEQHQMLMLGLHFVKYFVDREGHAEAEIVEQSFGDPAPFGRFLRHDSLPAPGPRHDYDFRQ